jgi:hypothetical protein
LLYAYDWFLSIVKYVTHNLRLNMTLETSQWKYMERYREVNIGVDSTCIKLSHAMVFLKMS